jgi:hypothetical protein
MGNRPGAARSALFACLLAALLAALLATLLATPAAAVAVAGSSRASAAAPAAAPVRHVVIVGLSGLRWSDVSPAVTPTLWRLAGEGSVGSLVDGGVVPVTCPADGWLTLNSGARAQSGDGDGGCGTFPAVVTDGTGAAVPGLSSLISYNKQFNNGPDWGLLASAASCSVAVGPGAALALADPAGRVGTYLPSPSGLTAAVLSRCPLTVVDLGNLGYTERPELLRSADSELARIVAELPAGTELLVTAPGATTSPPHLQVTLVDGPGYQAGLLEVSSTRQPGLVVLTDLTPTVLGWLGHGVPSTVVGAPITRGDRGKLGSAVRSLAARDTAEQVWLSTHEVFFWTYALADAVVLAAIGLAFWGAGPERRRQRARWWRVAGVFAVSVPLGTFLANLVPWWRLAHPAAWLYGVAVAWAVVIGLAALLGTRRLGPESLDDRLAPLGAVCLLTLAVLGIDVMTGSRLQLEAPFGLSVLEAGRFYGIGNEALGIYGVAALFGAAWLGLAALRRYPSSRRPAVLAVTAVGVFAVVASGWPGFGAKVGGTIAMVPCFLLLGLAMAGIRLSWRWVLLVAVSGVALFAIFALVSYFTRIAGQSDIGHFAGDVLHGHAGRVLLRKIHANVGSLALGAFSPLVPIVVVLTGLMLWRPSWFGLKLVPLAYAAQPLLRPVLAVLWLMPVLGWVADDSGVVVPAAALPMAVPLGIAIAAAAAYRDHQARYRGTTVAGLPVAGSTASQGRPALNQKVTRAVPAITHCRRPVPVHDLAAEGDRRGEHPRVRRRDPRGQPPVGRRFDLPAADGRPTGDVLGQGRVLHRVRSRGEVVGRVPEGHQPAADGPGRAAGRAGHAGGGAGSAPGGEPVRHLPGGDQVAGRPAVPGPARRRLAGAQVGPAGDPGRAGRHQAGAAAGQRGAPAGPHRGEDRQAARTGPRARRPGPG